MPMEEPCFWMRSGNCPYPSRVKFLRVLQENEIRPIGDSKTRSINARIIAATSKDLQESITQDMFRRDLFYRLNVLPIKIPPLRERPDDIPLLIMHFIERVGQSMNKELHDISKEAMPLLLRHSWPGNVRELENSIKRAAILADEAILTPDNFPFLRESMLVEKTRTSGFDGYSLKEAQKMLEKQFITRPSKRRAETEQRRPSSWKSVIHPCYRKSKRTISLYDGIADVISPISIEHCPR